jgi:hypothetical protein
MALCENGAVVCKVLKNNDEQNRGQDSWDRRNDKTLNPILSCDPVKEFVALCLG